MGRCNFLLEPFPLCLLGHLACPGPPSQAVSTFSSQGGVGKKARVWKESLILGKFNQAVSFYFYFLYFGKKASY